MFQNDRKGNEFFCPVDVLDNRQTEPMPRKCLRYGSEDHIIEKCPNPPKDNKKQQKQARFNEKGNCACDNDENNSDQKIYASMASMSGNDECPSQNYGDSLQLTNRILGSGAMCHMTTEVSDFISGSLEDTEKYIEFTESHHITAKQKCQVRIKMCNDNGNLFIATLHKVLLAPDLYDRLFQ